MKLIALLILFFFLCSCVLTEKEFNVKHKASAIKHCKMKMLHIPDSKEKEIKFKQCVYFTLQSRYSKYRVDKEKAAAEFQRRWDEKNERETQRKHELDLKTAPTNININTNSDEEQDYNENKAIDNLEKVQENMHRMMDRL